MSGVGRVAECIDDQKIKISHESQGRVWNGFYIGEVANTPTNIRFKQKTNSLDTAVEDRKRSDAKVADSEEGADHVGVWLNVASVGIVLVEGPSEHAFEHSQGGFGCVEGQGGIALPAESAHLVEAGHVVEVGVGVEDRVDFRDLFAKRLLAEIGAGIDE